jgi:hypothetical protein
MNRGSSRIQWGIIMNEGRQRRGIPSNDGREQIEKAIKEIIKDGVRSRRESRQWVLEYGGRHYPPKYVISLANRYSNGIELDAGDFTSYMARKHLKRLGYSIIRWTS